MTMQVKVEEIRGGRAVPFGPNGEPSAIAKEVLPGPVEIAESGIHGDEQGDKRHHGGGDKAVHQYPADHYRAWQAEGTRVDRRDPGPGAFGENLVTYGMTEADVCIGDVFRLGSAMLEVSQARQPCWRLNVRFGDPGMARQVQDSGRTGWYYRVLEPGHARAGDTLECVERPHPQWPLSRILDLFYRDPLNTAELEVLLDLPALAESWRGLVRRRIERGVVEDWQRRLRTPSD